MDILFKFEIVFRVKIILEDKNHLKSRRHIQVDLVNKFTFSLCSGETSIDVKAKINTFSIHLPLVKGLDKHCLWIRKHN